MARTVSLSRPYSRRPISASPDKFQQDALVDQSVWHESGSPTMAARTLVGAGRWNKFPSGRLIQR